MDRGRDGVFEDLALVAGTAAAGAVGWWLLGNHLVLAAAIASAALSVPAAVLADFAGPIRIPLLTAWLLAPSQAARDVLFSVPLGDMDSHPHVLVAGGRNAALLAVPLLVMAARSAFRLRPDLRYRTRHSLDSATAEQARMWPAAHRPLRRNLAADDQPETAVDAARAMSVRQAYSYTSNMGGGRGGLPVLNPPAEAVPLPSRQELRDRDPECLQVLDQVGFDLAAGDPLEAAAILLGVRGDWPAAAAVLGLAGWTAGTGEGGWHERFDCLAAAGRWEEATLACFLAGSSPEHPESGSFLFTPFPELEVPPPLGRALRPEEWLDARCLRDEEGECDPLAVEVHLAGQLTRPFSLSALRPHERAFAACIAGFLDNGSRKLIDELSVAFADCSGPGDVDRTIGSRHGIRAGIDDQLDRRGRQLAELAGGHFWMETALLEIWRAGREGGGILPPAALLWLKPEDRTLWYAIQCLGGNVVIEAAGVHAHHLAERQYRAALPVPNVRQAVSALMDVYLDQSPERVKARQQAGGTALRLDDPAQGGIG